VHSLRGTDALWWQSVFASDGYKERYENQMDAGKLDKAPWDAQTHVVYRTSYGLLYAAGACQARGVAGRRIVSLH
jgi:hypothetical protein